MNELPLFYCSVIKNHGDFMGMKKCLASAMIVISTLISCCFAVNATTIGLRSYDVTLHSDAEGTLLIGRSYNELYTKRCNYNSQNTEKIYTFNKKVLTHAVYKDKIYVVYPSDIQEYIHYMAVIENGKMTDLFHFYTKTLDTDCKMAAGSDGYFYIYNKKKQIDVYNQSGELVHTTDTFQNMLTVDDRCYGTQQDKIQEINYKGIAKTYKIANGFNLFNVSENYIARIGGEIYEFGSDTMDLVMNVELNMYINPCETENYIISVKDNCLLAYDKNHGQLRDSYQLSKDVYNISNYGEKITVVYKDNSVEFFNVSDIFKANTTTNKSKQRQITNGTDITIEYNDDIIILEQGTTTAQFRNSTTESVEFESSISGQLGTGDNVTINNQAHTIVIKGDITGEGNINSRDLNALFDHLLEIELLQNEFCTAADINNDNKISNADLVLLSRASVDTFSE